MWVGAQSNTAPVPQSQARWSQVATIGAGATRGKDVLRLAFMNSLQRFPSIRIETLCGLEISFINGREKLVAIRRRPLLSRWRRQLLILMSNNALDPELFKRVDLRPGQNVTRIPP